MDVRVWHCPKCSAQLQACGEVDTMGHTLPVFQCDSCTETKMIFGEPFEVALTFCISPEGRAIDAVDGILR